VTQTPEQLAREAVAEQFEAGPGPIEIVSVQAVDFRDSSLDCPRPDMAYLQVITPGYRIVARADGEEFDVRVSANRGLICDMQGKQEQRNVPRKRTY